MAFPCMRHTAYLIHRSPLWLIHWFFIRIRMIFIFVLEDATSKLSSYFFLVFDFDSCSSTVSIMRAVIEFYIIKQERRWLIAIIITITITITITIIVIHPFTLSLTWDAKSTLNLWTPTHSWQPRIQYSTSTPHVRKLSQTCTCTSKLQTRPHETQLAGFIHLDGLPQFVTIVIPRKLNEPAESNQIFYLIMNNKSKQFSAHHGECSVYFARLWWFLCDDWRLTINQNKWMNQSNHRMESINQSISIHCAI